MTSRPTQQDVQLALLALDAYNRGGNPQLKYTTDAVLSDTIGSATWIVASDDVLPESTAVGFSASQYSMGGKNVISYRGTDFPSSFSASQFLELAKDFGAGWLGSFGATGTDFAGQKLQLA
jgi:hypothetical protein